MPKRLFLSELRKGDRVISSTGQIFLVEEVRANVSFLQVKALSELRGPGSSRAQPMGESRSIINGHQWCMRMTWYGGEVGQAEAEALHG